MNALAAAHVEAYRSTGTSPGSTSEPTRHTVGRIAADVRLDHHGARNVPIGFEATGPDCAPAVVVLGGISASRHLVPGAHDSGPGWWPGVVGHARTVDPSRHLVVGVDYLGGAESSWRPEAPLTTRDQARAVVAVLDHLELERVTVVGASFGGMVALALGVTFPSRVRRLAVLCAAHRPHPMATAVRAIQRDIVRLGEAVGETARGIALARALAMTTYRTESELESRFSHRRDGDGDPARFPVERYLAARGDAFARRFSADAFVRLSESVDLHDVEPEALAVPTALLSVDSDALSPPWLVAELAHRAPGVDGHEVIDSTYGHDAFLKEDGAVSAWLAGALREVAR